MKLKKLAAAVLLSGAVSLTVSADLANDVKNQGAEAVIADAMRQGQSLETIMASLSTALKDSPLLLSQVVQQAVQSFPQQAATIVTVVVSNAPAQASQIVATTVQAIPEQASVIVQAAVTAQPQLAAQIVAETVSSAPEQASEIVSAAVTATPEQATQIVSSAVLSAPDQSQQITQSAVESVDSPALRASIVQASQDAQNEAKLIQQASNERKCRSRSRKSGNLRH